MIILTNKSFVSIFIMNIFDELQKFNNLPPKMAFWILEKYFSSSWASLTNGTSFRAVRATQRNSISENKYQKNSTQTNNKQTTKQIKQNHKRFLNHNKENWKGLLI